jgi:hypothetical protein
MLTLQIGGLQAAGEASSQRLRCTPPPMRQTRCMSADAAVAFWRAVGELHQDRWRGLKELETCVAGGSSPEGLDGRLRGRLLATTLGRGFDLAADAAARLWMPWLGKTFDGAANSGRNDFTAGAGLLFRFTFPRYSELKVEDSQRCSGFAFRSSISPSALDPDTAVLRIDYRDEPENPSWPVRRILDELVAVDDGLFLGQALFDWRGKLRRAAWFSLERS